MQQEENSESLVQQVIRVLYQPIPLFPTPTMIAKARAQAIKKKALKKLHNQSPTERKLRGKIHMLSRSRFEICEHVVEINEHTWLFGELKEGCIAEITVKEKAGIYQASKIIVV
jgi:hypothetical protein